VNGSSLRRHLVVAFVAFAVAILMATLIPIGILSASAHRASFIEQQRQEVEQVATAFGRSTLGQLQVDERYEGRDVAAWLLDVRGTPVGEPSSRQAFPARITVAPEVERARGGDTAYRIGDSPFGRRLFLATPILSAGRLSGVLWVSASLGPVDRLDSQRWALLAGIGAVTLLAAAVVGRRLARRLTRRLEIVAAGAERFGQGRLDEPIPVVGTDEIGALAGRLNTMAAEIDRLVGREKEFVAAASHQIRTPLAAIKIRIDELLASSADFEADSVAYLKEMAEEVDRLTTLTTRLLDLSSAEHAPQPGPLVVSRAIREAIDRVAPLAQHRDIEVRLVVDDEGAIVQAPPGALEEGLFNLLDNAVKFSQPGGAVDVGARLDNGSLLVEVADRGPGIPAGERARVLDPFYRVSRGKPGHGLGLAISARLCDSAGARLALTAREGGGTVAVIRWPVHPAA
jgi:signal transduction histidine kinase